MKKLWLGVALGAAIAFLFDPRSGRRRRKVGGDWSRARVRRAGRAVARTGRGVRAEAYGVSQKVQHLKEEEKPQPDDVTLAHKVESEIFRDAKVPKGQINVNAENGVVYLRGEAGEDMIRDLVEKTRKVQGVQAVENLLHVPGTPAPMHQ
jgi:osmotically-inducible protein OsmY